MILLNDLPLNHYAKVEYIDCDGIDRRRFLDLGIVQGTKLRPILKSPSGDPVAYEIRKSVIAIRSEDARKNSSSRGLTFTTFLVL